MSPEVRALKRVALAVASVLGGVALVVLLHMVLSPLTLVCIAFAGLVTYGFILMYDMYLYQEKAKDKE